MKEFARLTLLFHNAKMVSSVKFLCLAAILFISPLLNAQSFYGAVVGTVSDSSGAVVPGATITVTNLGTSESDKVETDSGGNYTFVNLIPASYRVTAEKTGFKRFVQASVPVQVGTTARINLSLAVGNVSETVEVTSAAPLLQADSSSLNQVVEGAQVQEMPLNGRNVLNLLELAPGVIPAGSALGTTAANQASGRTSGGLGWGNYQIGGAIQGEAAQFVDGAANNLLGGNIVALVPTQDAIQEFSVISSNANADFGRYGGGVVNMATKSGSNAFHGSVYEYIRNADFNSNDWFSNHNGSPRVQWNQNQYGAAINGPIMRNKAFFMFTWEGFREIIGNINPTNVPTLAMQNGVFAKTLSPDPLGICDVQPYTGQAVNGQMFPSGGTYIANLYGPGLKPGTTCGDPLNRILKTFYPLPNSSSSTANWFLSTPLRDNQNQYNSRVDYTISEKQRLFARYSYWKVGDTGRSEFLSKGLNGVDWPTNNPAHTIFVHQAVLGDTYTLSPTTLLDVRVDYTRTTDQQPVQDSNVNESQFDQFNPNKVYAALAPQMNMHVLPQYSLSGSDGLYLMRGPANFAGYWYNNYHLSANIVKILGSHSIKIGGEGRLQDNSGLPSVSGISGVFSYTNAFTGDEFASFLMGYPTQTQFQTFSETAGYSYYQAYYVADTWQAAPKLTLNLGLRYELPGAPAERNNKQTVLLPQATDPYTGIIGTLATVASPQYAPRTAVVEKYNLFAPRVGFAYRASSSTVLHGGYGLSYLPNDVAGIQGLGVLPFNSILNGGNTTVNVAASGSPVQLQTPLACIAGITSGSQCTALSITQAGLVPPIGRNVPNFMTSYGSLASYKNQIIGGPTPNQPYPYTQQWNLALSHGFKGDFMAQISYSGLHGTSLPGLGNSSFGIDELASQYYSLGTTVLNAKTGTATANAAGFSTCPRAPGLAAGAITVGQCLRPYPYYNNVLDYTHFAARQNYQSLQISAEKRFKSAGIIKANYSWAKDMSNADAQAGNLERGGALTGGQSIALTQDFNNIEGEYSLISSDVKNRLVASYVLNLPFGNGQKFGGGLNGAASALASGWSVDGITIFQSGFPLFFYSATANALTSTFGGGVLRPNMVPGCGKQIAGSNQTRVLAGAWFNTGCFTKAVTAADPNGDFTFGNEPRIDADLRADGIKNFDVSFQKSTPIFESSSFVFRAEFFNVLNRVQFAPPNTQFGSSNFGKIAYQVNRPRQIQLSARINF